MRITNSENISDAIGEVVAYYSEKNTIADGEFKTFSHCIYVSYVEVETDNEVIYADVLKTIRILINPESISAVLGSSLNGVFAEYPDKDGHCVFPMSGLGETECNKVCDYITAATGITFDGVHRYLYGLSMCKGKFDISRLDDSFSAKIKTQASI